MATEQSEVDYVLERYDQTDPALKREIVVAFVKKCLHAEQDRAELLAVLRKVAPLLRRYAMRSPALEPSVDQILPAVVALLARIKEG